jgi:hypothetical protein
VGAVVRWGDGGRNQGLWVGGWRHCMSTCACEQPRLGALHSLVHVSCQQVLSKYPG